MTKNMRANVQIDYRGYFCSLPLSFRKGANNIQYSYQETFKVISGVKFAGNLTIFDVFVSSIVR